jgi:hypothetical protein
MSSYVSFILIILLFQAPTARLCLYRYTYRYAAVMRGARDQMGDGEERGHVAEPLQHETVLQGGRP